MRAIRGYAIFNPLSHRTGGNVILAAQQQKNRRTIAFTSFVIAHVLFAKITVQTFQHSSNCVSKTPNKMALAFQSGDSIKQALLEELHNILSPNKEIRESAEGKMKHLEITEGNIFL